MSCADFEAVSVRPLLPVVFNHAIRSSFFLMAFATALALLMDAPAEGAVALLANPILFVTQVPIPNEVNDDTVSNVFVSVVSPLDNHLADTAHAGRGGDL